MYQSNLKAVRRANKEMLNLTRRSGRSCYNPFMRRWILILLLITTACRTAPAVEPVAVTLSPPATPTPAQPALRSIEPSPTGFTPPEEIPPATPSPPAAPAGYHVRIHPEDRLYVGDRVSFEVISPPDAEGDALVRATMPAAGGEASAEARFGRHGIGERRQAKLLWAWDTSGLSAGNHTVRFSITPNGPTWDETFELLPANGLPQPEMSARWQTVETGCCRVSYITGTPAERDLDRLLPMIEAQAAGVERLLNADLKEPVRIVLVPRVLGHGGFASEEISVSYLDRDYMGGDKSTVIHHEIVHIIDGRLGGELRPTMLVEGLAVYLSGGHFKSESLLPRAAALLPAEPGCVRWSVTGAADSPAEGCGLGRFIPLTTLANRFYFQQHEIGYLQAGALIAFIVERYGWEKFSRFYRDIHPPAPRLSGTAAGSDHARAMDAALRRHFGFGLEALESQFRAALAAEQVTPEIAEDLRQSIHFYDTARRYQEALDPSAHFLTAWLLDADAMRDRGIVADYFRRPSQPENLTLETMLVEAAGRIGAGVFDRAALLLDAVNTVLAADPANNPQAVFAHPVAADYRALVQFALDGGYQPERISIENRSARMLVSTSEPKMIELTLLRAPGGWTPVTASGLILPHPAGARGLYGGQLHKMPLRALKGVSQYRFK